MARRPGSFTFTFSKRNYDVRDIISQKKEQDEHFVVTDYMCEAVRFYEAHKDKFNSSALTTDDVRRIVNEILSVSSIKINTENEISTVKVIETCVNLDVDNITDSDLEED